MMTKHKTYEEYLAWQNEGEWVPAANGTEKPFMTKYGMRVLYCFQPRSGKHAYLDMDQDRVLEDCELAKYGL